MTVHALDRNQRALDINKRLYTLRMVFTNWSRYLRGTDVYNIEHLDTSRQTAESLRLFFDTFLVDGHGTWFARIFPDESAAITDGITALTAVRDEMERIITSAEYARAGDPRKAVLRADRDALATFIDTQRDT